MQNAEGRVSRRAGRPACMRHMRLVFVCPSLLMSHQVAQESCILPTQTLSGALNFVLVTTCRHKVSAKPAPNEATARVNDQMANLVAAPQPKANCMSLYETGVQQSTGFVRKKSFPHSCCAGVQARALNSSKTMATNTSMALSLCLGCAIGVVLHQSCCQRCTAVRSPLRLWCVVPPRSRSNPSNSIARLK